MEAKPAAVRREEMMRVARFGPGDRHRLECIEVSANELEPVVHLREVDERLSVGRQRLQAANTGRELIRLPQRQREAAHLKWRPVACLLADPHRGTDGQECDDD